MWLANIYHSDVPNVSLSKEPTKSAYWFNQFYPKMLKQAEQDDAGAKFGIAMIYLTGREEIKTYLNQCDYWFNNAIEAQRQQITEGIEKNYLITSRMLQQQLMSYRNKQNCLLNGTEQEKIDRLTKAYSIAFILEQQKLSPSPNYLSSAE